MPRPSDDYYKKLPERIGAALTPQQVLRSGSLQREVAFPSGQPG